MKKSIILSIIFLCAFQFKLLAQQNNSFQVNGGLMSATDSDKGIIGTVQFNHTINSSFSIYTYSGILYWNNNNITYDDGAVYKGGAAFNNFQNTYTEDSHKLIPFYAGAKYFFNNSSVFRPFVNIEIGFSYLIFNSYDLNQINNPDGTVTFEPVNKTERNNIFFGAGVGIGASHDIGDNLELLLEFRFNTLKNSSYDWLSSGRTLRAFQFGFAYKI
ncbi:MAG: outer membrane beta-barrel protein [Ignavibacteriaceae bacterium]